MRDPFELRTGSEHLDELVLDRLLADEREGLEQARTHLESCPECSARLQGLRAAKDEQLGAGAMAATVAAVLEGAQQQPAGGFTWFQRWLLLAGPVAAAAAIAVLVLWPPLGPSDLAPATDTVRLKGACYFGILMVEAGQRPRPVGEDDRLESGTRLVFEVGSDEAAELYLVNVSGSKAPVLMGQWAVRPGPPALLPTSATLDEAKGDERLFALFCAKQRPVKHILAALASIASGGGDPPLGCLLRERVIRRAATGDGGPDAR